MSTDVKYNRVLKKYVEDLSAKLPVPGGGSASALVGCLGVALMNMVLNFTIGKKKYRRYEKELIKVLRRNSKIQRELLRLVDEDIRAYKSANPRQSLKVPYKVCRLIPEVISFCPQAVKKTNRNLITDVADAAVFLEAGFSGAYYNVLINLRFLPDVKKNREILKELGSLKRKVKFLREKTEVEIGAIIGR